MENFIAVANRTNCDSVIVVDDYPSLLAPAGTNKGIGHAWENARRNHSIVELMRCMFSNFKTLPLSTSRGQYRQGFVVGLLNPQC